MHGDVSSELDLSINMKFICHSHIPIHMACKVFHAMFGCICALVVGQVWRFLFLVSHCYSKSPGFQGSVDFKVSD